MTCLLIWRQTYNIRLEAGVLSLGFAIKVIQIAKRPLKSVLLSFLADTTYLKSCLSGHSFLWGPWHDTASAACVRCFQAALCILLALDGPPAFIHHSWPSCVSCWRDKVEEHKQKSLLSYYFFQTCRWNKEPGCGEDDYCFHPMSANIF